MGVLFSILKCHLGFVLKPRLGLFFFHFEFVNQNLIVIGKLPVMLSCDRGKGRFLN